MKQKIIEIRTHLDRIKNKLCSKSSTNLLTFYKKYEKICTNLCPIHCIDNEFIITYKHQYIEYKTDPKIWKMELFWDDS